MYPGQFTLRTMLIVVAVAAIGTWVARIAREAMLPKTPLDYAAPYLIPADAAQVAFDAEQWRQRPYDNRLSMVQDVLTNHLRVGWTRQQVVTLLGNDDVGDGPGRETYIVKQVEYGNAAHGCLRITFDANDCLEKCELVTLDLTI